MNEGAPRRGGAPLRRDGTVVVVGAGLAGLRAAETLRQEGLTGRVVLVGEEPHPPYDRPPLSKQVLAGAWEPERTVLADHERLAAQGIEHQPARRAVSLDVEGRAVTLDDGSRICADAVVVATGAAPRRLAGTEGEWPRVLRTLDDAVSLRHEVLRHGPGCKVVVVGAGFIGSEVASTCHELGAEVVVLEALDTPLEPALGPVVGAACAALHASSGVELRTKATVRALSAPEGSSPGRVTLADGTSLVADVVVVGIGVVPRTDWLAGSGLELHDGVRCDPALCGAPGIVAAGDLARWWHEGLGEEVRIEHWQVAAEQGVAAARSLLAGQEAPAFAPVPYFWSDQYGVRIQVLGRPRPSDEVVVVDGSLNGGRFVALYAHHGRLTAAIGVSRPRQLMALRPLLERGATVKEAEAAVG